jgi:hypothetical protein
MVKREKQVEAVFGLAIKVGKGGKKVPEFIWTIISIVSFSL